MSGAGLPTSRWRAPASRPRASLGGCNCPAGPRPGWMGRRRRRRHALRQLAAAVAAWGTIGLFATLAFSSVGQAHLHAPAQRRLQQTGPPPLAGRANNVSGLANGTDSDGLDWDGGSLEDDFGSLDDGPSAEELEPVPEPQPGGSEPMPAPGPLPEPVDPTLQPAPELQPEPEPEPEPTELQSTDPQPIESESELAADPVPIPAPVPIPTVEPEPEPEPELSGVDGSWVWEELELEPEPAPEYDLASDRCIGALPPLAPLPLHVPLCCCTWLAFLNNCVRFVRARTPRPAVIVAIPRESCSVSQRTHGRHRRPTR